MIVRAPSILSLDVATHTGVCDGAADEVPKFYTLDFSRASGDHPGTFAEALRWIAGRLKVSRPDVIYIEAPLRMGAASGQTNADTVLRLYGLYAVFSAAAVLQNIRVVDVSVQDVRQAFLGSRVVPRDTAKPRAKAMCEAIGWTPKDLDQADAGAVHWYAIRKEAPKLAPLVTPMMQHEIATRVEREAILRAESKRKRAIEIEAEKARKAARKAAQIEAAELLFRRG